MLKDLKWKADFLTWLTSGPRFSSFHLSLPVFADVAWVIITNLSAAHFTNVQYLCEAEKKWRSNFMQMKRQKRAFLIWSTFSDIRWWLNIEVD